MADGDQTGLCRRLINVVALLSAAGVSRALLYAAGKEGILQQPGSDAAAGPESIDEALGRLANVSLLTFSVDDSTVAAHRLTMRVARERQATGGQPGRARRGRSRPAVRGNPVPGRALAEPARCPRCGPADHGPARAPRALLERRKAHVTETLLRLRRWAIWCLNDLGGSFAQAIEYGQDLVADCERVLGDTHPDTLTSRNNLARAYRDAGRLDEAIPLFERTLADRERILGDTHPDTLTTRNNLARCLPGRRAAGRGHPAPRAHPRRPRAGPGRHSPRHPASPQQPPPRYGPPGGWTRPSRCSSAPSPTASGSWARLTPTPWPPATTSPRAYRAAGRLDEAIPLLERTLADRERVLGDDSPRHPGLPQQPRSPPTGPPGGWTRPSCCWSAPSPTASGSWATPTPHPDHPQQPRSAYQAAGRLDEAIPLFERTLADRERVLGEAHPDTLTTRNNLARRLPGRRAAGRGHPAVRAHPRRLRAGPGRRPTPTPWPPAITSRPPTRTPGGWTRLKPCGP